MPYIETEARYENTTMREIRNNANALTGYDISPVNDYVLHNITFDNYEYDEITHERTKLVNKGYSPSSCSVEADYDFDANPKEIYAIKINDVGENDIIH